ncbi:microcystin-dependent protein [Lutibacter oceani]|uniref:Microcystin-dependent protein n=1 Tax=Lutibacter oceani TaxID=1853311 RepID=A0A3D9RTA4_9FLAO|nr:tail fiber protein [Lutibacter oceani]REE80356.1 microcystin-dependent protein [Lutibacter oceani]
MSSPLLGSVIMFAGNFAPRGWAFCDGQLLAISQNTALFSILGTTYGGDGRTTFALPDLRGRAPIGSRTGPGLSPINLGQKSGTETNTLNTTQLPSHTHIAQGTTKVSNADGTTNNPDGKVLAVGKAVADRTTSYNANIYGDTANANMASNNVTVTVGSTGGNLPINNRPPFLAVNYIIALQGIFPSRN